MTANPMRLIVIEDSESRARKFAEQALIRGFKIEFIHLNGNFLDDPPADHTQLAPDDRRKFTRYSACKTIEHAAEELTLVTNGSLIFLDCNLGAHVRSTHLAGHIGKWCEDQREAGQTAFVLVYSQSEDAAKQTASLISQGRADVADYYPDSADESPGIIAEIIDHGIRRWAEKEKSKGDRTFDLIWPENTRDYFRGETSVFHTWQDLFEKPPTAGDIGRCLSGESDGPQAKYVKLVSSYLRSVWGVKDVPPAWFQDDGLHESLKHVVGSYARAHLGYRQKHGETIPTESPVPYDLTIGSLAILLGAATVPNNSWITKVMWPKRCAPLVGEQTNRQAYELVWALLHRDDGLFSQLKTSKQRGGPGIKAVQLTATSLSIYLRFSTDNLLPRLHYKEDKVGQLFTNLRRVMDALSRCERGIDQKCKVRFITDDEDSSLTRLVFAAS
jgi:hypothetical protein